MKQVFLIKGMSCAVCQNHVNKAVSSLEGITEVNVNLITNKMIVLYDENICSEKKIIEAVKQSGYTAYLNKEDKKDYSLLKIIVSGFLVIILMIISMNDFKIDDFLLAIIQFVFVLPILFIYRKYFIVGFKRLFSGKPSMDSLIAIGATASIIYGIYAIFMIKFGNNGSIDYQKSLYFESAGMILTLVSLGKYFEQMSKKKTTAAITKLMGLAPKTAIVIRDEKEQEIAANDVEKNDIVIIKKGMSIPVDGIIVDGKASIEEANITGESMPVYKQKEDFVYASTIVISGYIVIKATRVKEDTSIANIMKLVEEASNSKAPISKLADKVSGFFIPIIMILAVIDFIVFLVIADGELAFNFAISMLVIACPCALGLATPVAIMVGTGKGAENGLLIRNAEILEKTHHIKTVVLDKTGTITYGKPKVVDFKLYSNIDVLSIAYSFEKKSEHPLATAIIDYTKESAKELEVTNYESIEGKGLKGKIDNEEYYIGNYLFLKDSGIDDSIIDYSSYMKQGKTVLLVINKNKIIGLFAIKDEIKKNSKEAITRLTKQGIEVIILTGDNASSANSIANEVGITRVYSEVLPSDKQRIINSLKKDEKHLVAMVGDGVNDAPALMSADLGIAIGNGSDIALESSDIVLIKNDLLDLLSVISLSKRVIRTIKGNLFWAFFYNCIGILFASGIFYFSFGIMLNPMISALAMSFSSVFVVLNALTINLFHKYGGEKMEKYVLKVEGMRCGMCESHVNDAVRKLYPKAKVKSKHSKNQTVIQTNESININRVIEEINRLGYSAKENI